MKKTEKVKPIPALREPSLVEPLGEQAAQRAAQPALKAESPPGQVPRDLPRAAPIKARAWKTTIAPRNAGGDDDQASRMIHMEKNTPYARADGASRSADATAARSRKR
jgi:hypothetical protein